MKRYEIVVRVRRRRLIVKVVPATTKQRLTFNQRDADRDPVPGKAAG